MNTWPKYALYNPITDSCFRYGRSETPTLFDTEADAYAKLRRAPPGIQPRQVVEIQSWENLREYDRYLELPQD